MIKHLRYIIIILLLFSFNSASSQSIKKLRANKKKIEKEITYLNKLILSSSKNKKITVNKLVLVTKQIDNRERLITNIEQESNSLSNSIATNKHSIVVSNKKLESLKELYAAIIYNSWLHKSVKNKFIFLMSSYDFNQAYIRIKYLKQYSDYTERLAKQIVSLKKSLANSNLRLSKQYKEKQLIANNLTNEKLSLAKEKTKHSRYISSLSSKQKKLKQKLNRQLKAQSKLTARIKYLIKLEAKKKRKRSSGDKVLSKNFAKNKGKLPWPTKSGFISSGFGVHQHPVAKRTKVRNDGIDITTDANADCFAVFSGVISEVFNFPGLNNIIMLRHGDYLTVYANISKVYVRKGDKIKTGQAIGMIYTDSSERKTVLKFQLWKNSLKQNPSRWLSK